jgi:hypothetical protein
LPAQIVDLCQDASGRVQFRETDDQALKEPKDIGIIFSGRAEFLKLMDVVSTNQMQKEQIGIYQQTGL